MKFIIRTFILILLVENLHADTNYFNDGLKFYKDKKYEMAKFKFEQDIVFNPKSEKSYLYLSKIFNYQKKKEFEEQNLNTVLLINPKNEEATFNLAKLKLEKSDFKGSEKLIDRLLSFCKNYCQKSEELKIEVKKSLKK